MSFWWFFPGTYASSQGSVSCTVCSAGHRCDAVSESECGTGFYSSAASHICTECPTGHSCPSNRETAPTPCVPGQYQVKWLISVNSEVCSRFCLRNVTRMWFLVFVWHQMFDRIAVNHFCLRILSCTSKFDILVIIIITWLFRFRISRVSQPACRVTLGFSARALEWWLVVLVQTAPTSPQQGNRTA